MEEVPPSSAGDGISSISPSLVSVEPGGRAEQEDGHGDPFEASAKGLSHFSSS